MYKKCLYLPDNTFMCAHDLDGANNPCILSGAVQRTESTKMQRMYIFNKMNGNYDALSNFGASRRYGCNGVTGVNGLYKRYRLHI